MSALTAAGSTRAWRRLRRLTLERDGYRCQLPADDGDGLCLAWASHADHIVPRSQGGTDDLSNLRAACATHNLRRGAGGAGYHRRPTVPARWRW